MSVKFMFSIKAGKSDGVQVFTYYRRKHNLYYDDDVAEYELGYPGWCPDVDSGKEDTEEEEEEEIVEEVVEEVRVNTRKSKYWDYFTDSSVESDNSEDEREAAEEKRKMEEFIAAKVLPDPDHKFQIISPISPLTPLSPISLGFGRSSGHPVFPMYFKESPSSPCFSPFEDDELTPSLKELNIELLPKRLNTDWNIS